MSRITATAIAPKSDHTPLTLASKQIIALVLTWDCQRQVSADEIEAIAIQHDILWVKLTDNRAIPLHVKTFQAIRAAQQEPLNDEVTEVPVLPETRLEVYKTPFSRLKVVHSYKQGKEGFTRYVIESNGITPPSCTCPDYSYRHRDCKHIRAINEATKPLELEPVKPQAIKPKLAYDIANIATQGNYAGLKAHKALRNKAMSVTNQEAA
jgi:hypothetical protein